MNVSWHDDKMRLSNRSHTQLRAPRSGKIAWGLWVITICRSILFDEHHRHGSTEQHWQARRRSTHLEYDPFLFPNSPALWHCWEMMAQSSKPRAGTYNKHHNVNPPPATGAETMCHQQVCTKAWNIQSSGRQSTNRNPLLVGLFALQATRLRGHTVLTNCGVRDYFTFVYLFIYIFDMHFLYIHRHFVLSI